VVAMYSGWIYKSVICTVIEMGFPKKNISKR
jgi:hypothetical protein